MADITRVITFSLDREASMRTYTNLGIAEGFHPLSHHGNNPAKQDMTLKGSVEGKTYVGPGPDPAGADDREVVTFDGRVLILKWVDRFPVIVYIGAGVLAWTAAQMMLHEPILMPHLHERDVLKASTYLVVIAGVLLAGFLAERRHRRTRVAPSGERL